MTAMPFGGSNGIAERIEALRPGDRITRQVVEDVAHLGLEVAKQRDEAIDDRNHWIRMFNSLEKSVTKHLEQFPEDEDLARAHRAVMRKAHERWQPASDTSTKEPF